MHLRHEVGRPEGVTLDKRLIELASLALIPLVAAGCEPATTIAMASPRVSDLAMADSILGSTLTIRIIAPHMDENGNRLYLSEDGREVPLNAISSGLGTIVSAGEGTLIVTADHYEQLSASAADVTLTDMDGRVIMLSLDTFRQLIRYRDKNIMLLAAPPGLPAGVKPGDGDRVPPGSHVQVVHRQPATGELSVVEGVIEHWIDYRGTPSYQLRNLNGELIEPGNSGGGVWFQGQLVGSIQRTILVDEAGVILMSEAIPGSPSHLSYATRLSPMRIPLLNQGQPIAEVPK